MEKGQQARQGPEGAGPVRRRRRTPPTPHQTMTGVMGGVMGGVGAGVKAAGSPGVVRCHGPGGIKTGGWKKGRKGRR